MAHLGEGEEDEEEGGFGEGRELDFAGGAHGLETGSGVEGGEDGHESARAEEGDDGQQVAFEGDGGAEGAPGQEKEGERRGGEADDRTEGQEGGGGAAENGAALKEFEEIEIELQEGRALAPGDGGLDLVDQAGKEGRSEQGGHRGQKREGEGGIHSVTLQSRTPTRAMMI